MLNALFPERLWNCVYACITLFEFYCGRLYFRDTEQSASVKVKAGKRLVWDDVMLNVESEINLVTRSMVELDPGFAHTHWSIILRKQYGYGDLFGSLFEVTFLYNAENMESHGFYTYNNMSSLYKSF